MTLLCEGLDLAKERADDANLGVPVKPSPRH